VSLGEKLKARREELGLDQLDVAQMLDVAQSSVCDWEKDRMRPQRRRLPMLAKVLRVKPARITEWWLAL
jgi:transcriptional regulator with XRE-family HTH domain